MRAAFVRGVFSDEGSGDTLRGGIKPRLELVVVDVIRPNDVKTVESQSQAVVSRDDFRPFADAEESYFESTRKVSLPPPG